MKSKPSLNVSKGFMAICNIVFNYVCGQFFKRDGIALVRDRNATRHVSLLSIAVGGGSFKGIRAYGFIEPPSIRTVIIDLKSVIALTTDACIFPTCFSFAHGIRIISEERWEISGNLHQKRDMFLINF